jgi:hypothetical protein
MNRKVSVFSFVCLLGAGVLTLNSCLKQNNTPPQPTGRISVLQASPDAPSMDLYLNGSKVNTSQVITFASGGSLNQPVGTYAVSFADAATGDTLMSHTDSVGNGFYSLIVYDTGSRRDFMYFPEQFEQATDNSAAYVRFLQLSPNAGLTDVYVGTSKKYAQRSFADNLPDPTLSEFGTITPGTYSFTALNSSTGDTLATLQDITLSSGGAYTVFLQGLAGRSDSLGLKLNYMLNYYQ